MQLTSARFVTEAQRSHTVICEIAVWQYGSPVREVDGTEMVVYALSGSITEDITAPIRQTMTMEVPTFTIRGTNLVPDDDGNGPIMGGVAGSELRVRRGFRYPTVNAETGLFEETVQWGTFRVTDVNLAEDDKGTPVLSVEASDLSWTLTSRVRNPFRIDAGTEVGAAFRTIVNSKNPALEVITTDTRFTVPSAMVINSSMNPWEQALKLAASAGCEAFADNDGQIVMRPSSLRTDASFVWQFTEGATATFSEPSRRLDSDISANVVIVIGNSGSATGSVKAVAFDNDPHSPTYVGRGEIVREVTTELVDTVDQAQEMADALLAESLAAHEELHAITSCIPMLSGGDVCELTRARLGVNRRTANIVTQTKPLTSSDKQELTFRKMPVVGLT